MIMAALMITMILFEANLLEKKIHDFIYCFSSIFQLKYIMVICLCH